MKKVVTYKLIYKPGGNGFIEFLLDGEGELREIGPLSETVFVAMAAVVSRRFCFFDDQRFLSSDREDLFENLS